MNVFASVKHINVGFFACFHSFSTVLKVLSSSTFHIIHLLLDTWLHMSLEIPQKILLVSPDHYHPVFVIF